VALHRNVHQGSYGEAFVHALACAAGFTVGRQHLDVHGVDWQIASAGPRGSLRDPRIEVQVKTWTSARKTPSDWVGRLRAAHFNALAGRGFMIPRFLVAVIVPKDPDDYVQSSPAAMILSHAAYWLSLADQPPTDTDGSETVSVQVPRSNLLTVETLTALVHGEQEGTRA
jgi:hypothetical protein